MNLDELQKRAIEIRDKYDELNSQKCGITWNEQQLMAGFVGDVGDLSKIIMAKHGLQAMDNIDEKLHTNYLTVYGRFWSWLANTVST